MCHLGYVTFESYKMLPLSHARLICARLGVSSGNLAGAPDETGTALCYMCTCTYVVIIYQKWVPPGSENWQRPSRNRMISSFSSSHSETITQSACLKAMLFLNGLNLSLTLILFLTVTNNLKKYSPRHRHVKYITIPNGYLSGITARINDSTFSAFHATSASESALLNTEHSADSSCL